MLNTAARNFISALKVAKDKGFDPLIVLAHAWHESGAFEHIIGLNNYWGVKTPDNPMNWNGKSVEVWTHEYEPVQDVMAADGKRPETQDEALLRIIRKYGRTNARIDRQIKNNWFVALPQAFRDWDTNQDAILWYCDFIARVYPAAFSGRQDAAAYFGGLVSGRLKYATDPSYVSQCMATYENLKKSIVV